VRRPDDACLRLTIGDPERRAIERADRLDEAIALPERSQQFDTPRVALAVSAIGRRNPVDLAIDSHFELSVPLLSRSVSPDVAAQRIVMAVAHVTQCPCCAFWLSPSWPSLADARQP
jgi:hypothetical protein